MTRPLRVRFAALAACVIAFAQIAVAAQPWPIETAPHRYAPPALADADVGHAHCSGVGSDADAPATKPGTPSPNFCEVHCQDAAQPDAMVVAVASPIPAAWLPVPLADPSLERVRFVAPVDAKCASPPARVLFSRFLN